MADRWLNVNHGVRQVSAEERPAWNEYNALELAQLDWKRRANAWLLGSVRTDDLGVLHEGARLVEQADALVARGEGLTQLDPMHLPMTLTTSDGSTYTHLLQTDAGITSGDSGGALVDAAGHITGINTAASSATNIGFAIAIDDASPILSRLSH